MIVEIGLFRVEPSSLDSFQPIAQDIRRAFAEQSIPGLGSFHMGPALEDPSRWTVIVAWQTLQDHRSFVASPEGQRQQKLLEPYMSETPEILHLSLPEVVGGLS
ncbi:MAG: Antibiotic biosynthesis monooxygenase [Acidimicrobiaceae bacterium]|nr:Antibiotic biosynthesis monooxygenase [Acidimicrobiaceae bacterium]